MARISIICMHSTSYWVKIRRIAWKGILKIQNQRRQECVYSLAILLMRQGNILNALCLDKSCRECIMHALMLQWMMPRQCLINASSVLSKQAANSPDAQHQNLSTFPQDIRHISSWAVKRFRQSWTCVLFSIPGGNQFASLYNLVYCRVSRFGNGLTCAGNIFLEIPWRCLYPAKPLHSKHFHCFRCFFEVCLEEVQHCLPPFPSSKLPQHPRVSMVFRLPPPPCLNSKVIFIESCRKTETLQILVSTNKVRGNI